jgi:hypothetical protein
MVFGEAHLRRILKAYAAYYEVKTHLSLRNDAPKFRRVQSIGSLAALRLPGGLHHQYFRIQFAQAHPEIGSQKSFEFDLH